MNPLPERVEAHCPRCNAAFVVSPSSQTRKIQCPNCRRAIAVAVAPEAPPAPDPIAARIAELEARIDRQESLIAEILRKRPSAPEPPLTQPSGDSLLGPGQSLRWLQREAHTWSASDYETEQQGILLHNLRAMGQRDIVVQAGMEDSNGQRLATRLASILREAGWRVSGPNSLEGQRPTHGLAISAGQCPLPKSATAAYMALQAAGYPVTSRLDSTLGPEGWILIVGHTSEDAR